MTNVDYIIVGQGLAGTLLAHELHKKGQTFRLFDPGLEGSASVVGAGIVNPVTGRRIVKSWLIDEYLPICQRTFQEIEALLNVRVYFPRNVLRVFYKAQQENDWLAKTSLPEFSNYLNARPDPAGFEHVFGSVFSWGEVNNSAWVDMAETVKAYRKYFLEKGWLTPDRVDYDQLKIEKDQVSYQGVLAKGIVFCEGWKSAQNPFFDYLPHDPAKGEV
ncbi:MAG: FAD-dependent oxidoreductase, partial [Bacteroidota bacterium]